jgi:hypothetical protein
MAIKGKGKSKARSGRVVTAGPRPAYVPPKVPWTQRTGAKFTFALFIELLVFALLVGFGEQSEGEREKLAVGEFTSLVDTSLFQGPAVQPLPAGALVLPEMATTLTSLTGEDPPPAEDVVEQAEGWSEAVLAVGDDLSGVEVPRENLEPEQVLALTEARSSMERGLAMYAGLAQQVAVAAEIEGEPQERLIATIQSQLQVAASLFDAGYGKMQELRRVLGLQTTATVPGGGFPPQGGIPGEGFPAEGLPEGFEEQLEEVPVDEAPADNGGGGGGGGGEGGGGGNG